MNAPDADLHVEHQSAGALGDLLAHDGAGDQRDGLDGPGDVTQRVELLVGRRQSAAPAAQITAPTSLPTGSCIASSADRSARHPGIDSNLSSVPPVWPSPRPDSCGTATPQAATKGASGRVILSPTPPVECLSAVGVATDPRSPSARRRRSSRRSSGRSRWRVIPIQQDRHRQCRHLLISHDAAGIGVDDPVDLRVVSTRGCRAWRG